MTESTDKHPLDQPPLDMSLPDEQQLDEYLKGDSSVSRQYRQLHSAEVPAELDRLVLRQAEDAVKSRSSRRPSWLRWTAPLAVAASAVLALAIVIETGVRDETVVMSAPEPTMQAKQRERAENKAEEGLVAQPSAPASASSPDATAEAEDELAADTRSTSPEPEIVTRAAPPPPSLDIPSPRAMRADEPVVETQAPKAVAQRRSAPPPAAAPSAEMTGSAQSVARSAEVAARELQAAAARDTAEHQGAPAALAYSRPISAEISQLPPTYTDPEAWLKDIRQLRKDNKQEQADREWRRFRAAFPHYEVAETDTAREVKK